MTLAMSCAGQRATGLICSRRFGNCIYLEHPCFYPPAFLCFGATVHFHMSLLCIASLLKYILRSSTISIRSGMVEIRSIGDSGELEF